MSPNSSIAERQRLKRVLTTHLSFRKTGTMETLASQAEIGALRPGTWGVSAGARSITTRRKILTLCMQNPDN